MYLGFQGLQALVQPLPLRLVRVVGRALGALAYALLGEQRRLAAAHLEYAWGASLSAAQRSRIVRGVFRNLGQTAMEWLVLPRFSKEDLQRLIDVQGLEHLRAALSRGNGVIMVTGHLGNWELLPVCLRELGFEGGVLARRLRYPEYESFLIKLRGARGIPTFARGSIKEVAKLLRANQIVGVLTDQDTNSLEGVFVEFFGHPAYTPVGPSALSMITGSPILPCFVVREGARFRLVIEPPVAVPPLEDRARTLTAMTQAWSRTIESYIRRYPDQWVWMHRRWKTQPATGDLRPATCDPQPSKSCSHPPAANRALRVGVTVAGCWLLAAALLGGCGKQGAAREPEAPQAEQATATPDPNAAQQMSRFTLTGYGDTGAKRWQLDGEGASVDGTVVTIHRPDAIGYDVDRTAHLTASAAQVNQKNRHVRLEHDVTIQTSDGLWFTAPVLHWIPDLNQVATDTPVRIETDHMLVRGRGLEGKTQLKYAKILDDVELVLNPSDHDVPSTGPKQVTITCDGPLAFDYEHNVATFEQNVHIKDPNGDLYSDKLIAYLDEATHTIRYAEAIGRVRINQRQNTAVSERAVYEPAVGKITLVGKPSLVVYPSEGSGPSDLSFGGLITAPVASPVPGVKLPTEPSGTGTHD
jgi:KDO2-lipid IV(A) lauroyltransferase